MFWAISQSLCAMKYKIRHDNNNLNHLIHYLLFIIMKISDNQQKRLVENYKITNKQLRRQLENLNNEIDRIIEFKTNRLGLKKLPNVDKSIQKTQDIKVIQVQVDNLRKRLEQLNRDKQTLKNKMGIDYLQQIKALEDKLNAKKLQKQALKKQVQLIDKTCMQLNTTDAINEEMKLYERIQQANKELLRVKKMYAELQWEIGQKKKIEQKKTELITQKVQHHQKIQSEVSQILASRVEVPITHTSNISDEQWKKLKKEFLQFKQSKQHEQNQLNEENERLRIDVRQLQLRLKQKKYTVQNIKSLEIRRKQRNYSTLDNSSGANQDNFRYRHRNNSYKYTAKS